MPTHSSVLAWRIPGMEQPGGLLSMGSHRVRHNRSDLAAAAAESSLPGLQMGFFTASSYGRRELSGVSSYKGINPITRVPSSSPHLKHIVFQRPCLQIPSCYRSTHESVEQHYSVHSTPLSEWVIHRRPRWDQNWPSQMLPYIKIPIDKLEMLTLHFQEQKKKWSVILLPSDDCTYKTLIGTYLVVQWLRLHIPNVGGLGLILGWEIKIPHAMHAC